MNERIKELIQKATKVYKPDWNGAEGFEEFDKEKFAELIVRECNYLIQQQVSLKYKDGWEQSGISDDWACGHYAASILSRTVIKQHFGVKE
jgi:hypothetical protein